MIRPKFIKPGESDSLYPIRNKDGTIETLINPNTDSALTNDRDSHSNFVYNRYHHLPINTQRQKLPVFQYRDQILYLLEKYQTLVLIGETGCGKSTQVPQYLHEIGNTVCVTQPRVTAAISLALRVREEAGECVGYAAGATSMRDANTSIIYMTEGVLLREMFASPLLMQYSCIMLDEVHERSLMTDVLMGLLKKIIKKRKKLKLIISSATIDAEFFRDFFNLTDKKDEANAPTSVIMSMRGRTYPLNIFYSEEPVPDYVKATVDTVIKIHENEPFGDILAFLTSQEEIHTALEILQTYAEQNNSQTKNRSYFPSGVQSCNISILPMYGSLPYYRQIKVFQMADHNVRKVILGTNIAETSITVPGIVYVIDCGFHKLPFFDATPGVECVSVCPITKCNATQRAGRAARTKQGNCYRLYTEAEYEKLLPSVPPEMCRSDLSSILLQLKALGIHNLLRFSFPTPPPAKSLLAALEMLYALNSIDKVGQLTEKGKMMAELPTSCMSSKMIVESGEYGCMDEILDICAMLHVDNVFIKSATGKDNINARRTWRDNFEVAEGDILTYLNIFDSYQKVRNKVKDERKSLKMCKEWCHKMYLNYRVMEKAFEIRKNLDKLVRHKFKIENKTYDGPDLGSVKCERIMRCVVSGYFPQAVSVSQRGDYRGARGARLHYNGEVQSKWLIYTNIQCTYDKVFMKDVMAIKKEWLLEIAPHYYKET